jgi:hypothetical protein
MKKLLIIIFGSLCLSGFSQMLNYDTSSLFFTRNGHRMLIVTHPRNISNLLLTPAGTSITLSWTDNSADEDGFIIQRGLFGGSFTDIDTVTVNTFNNTGLNYETGYKYKVIAYNKIGKSSGIKDSTTTWTWPKTMMESFVTINSPYVTYTQVEKDTIQGRLATSYMVSTFGPSGQNKTTCDFMMIFWNSNTSTNLITRTNTKTGATLRWNYGAGNIYSQNNLPANITNGVVTVSSTDGFNGWTVFDLNTNTFKYGFPIGSLPSGLTALYLHTNSFTGDWTNKTLSSGLTVLYLSVNSFTGDWTNKTLPSGLTVLYLHTNSFTGDWTNKTLSSGLTVLHLSANSFTGAPPNITLHATNGLIYRAYSPNGFTTASNVTTFRKAMTEFRLDGNALPTDKVDELLHNMALWYGLEIEGVKVNAPTADCVINLSGATMGIPTGGASNTDLVALQNIWTAAGKLLTITVRTS